MTVKTSIPWIKLPTALLDDTSFTYSLTPNQRDIYIRLYLLAAKIDRLGNLVGDDTKPLTAKAISWLLRERDTRNVERAIKGIRAAGLLGANGHGYFITNFTREQGETRHSDRLEQWRDRQAKHRALEPVTRDTPEILSSVFAKKKKKSKSKSKSKSNSKSKIRSRSRTTPPPSAAAAAAAGILIKAGLSSVRANELAGLAHVTDRYSRAIVWTWRQKPSPSTGLLVKMIRDGDTPSYNDYANRPREESESDREYHERTIKKLQEDIKRL